MQSYVQNVALCCLPRILLCLHLNNPYPLHSLHFFPRSGLFVISIQGVRYIYLLHLRDNVS